MIDINKLSRWCDANGKVLDVEGNQPVLLVIGGSARLKQHENMQDELIKIVQPRRILESYYMGAQWYNPMTGIMQPLPDRPGAEDDAKLTGSMDKRLKRLARRYDAEVVGIGITQTEESTLMSVVNEELKQDITQPHDDRMLPLISNDLANKIVKYASPKDKQPCVAIIGSDYLNRNKCSQLREILQENINYVSINLNEMNEFLN